MSLDYRSDIENGTRSVSYVHSHFPLVSLTTEPTLDPQNSTSFYLRIDFLSVKYRKYGSETARYEYIVLRVRCIFVLDFSCLNEYYLL